MPMPVATSSSAVFFKDKKTDDFLLDALLFAVPVLLLKVVLAHVPAVIPVHVVNIII